MKLEIPSWRKSKASAILPSESGDGWGLWRKAGVGAPSTGDADETIESPSVASVGRGGAMVGLPANSCQTVPLFLPPGTDPALRRKAVLAQLEKRGLSRPDAGATLFGCHAIPRVSGDGATSSANGGDLWSIDVVTDELGEGVILPDARGYSAAARLFEIPENRLVVAVERGSLVCYAGRGGAVVHAHVLGGRDSLGEAGTASGLRSTILALEASGVTPTLDGIELWGDFPEGDVGRFRAQVGVPVTVRPRPAPSVHPRPSAGRGSVILPAPVVATQRRRRWRAWKLLAALAAIGGYCLAVVHLNKRVRWLEARAAALETEVANTSGPAEQVKAAGSRWNSLRNVIEPKRYPLVHLDHITRVMPPGGVVLTRFESKVSEVNFTGTARGPKEAYAFFGAVTGDAALNVYSWSMERPAIREDGSAAFQIKGKMR